MSVERQWRALVVLITVAVLGALVPLAHASPPDQTWIRGLYDDGDYDDVVILGTSAVAVLDVAAPVLGAGVLVAVDRVPDPVPAPPSGRGTAPHCSRAPPWA